MRILSGRIHYLLASTAALLLLIIGGCSGAADGQPAAAGEQRRASAPSQSAQPLPPCSDGEFILSETLLTTGERIDIEEHGLRRSERRHEQEGWLSLHLGLAQNAFEYGQRVWFVLTITNETDHPVIFRRPKFAFLAGAFVPVDQILVEVISSTGERILDVSAQRDLFPPFPSREDFSVLPAGQSCTITFILSEGPGLPRLTPPPGDYYVNALLHSYSLGPHIGTDESGKSVFCDVGAWVGIAGPSNEATLTILPPDE